MYCKNCGKDLPDNARFCDKCNMSVRKKEGKMDLIEELKEERLARQKAHEIEARLKKIRRVKRKRYRTVALIVFAIIVVWGGVILWSYWQNSKNSSITSDKAEYAPTQTPTPTAVATEKPKEAVYENETVDGITITYPKGFKKEENADYVASYSDENATIRVTRVVATTTPNELANRYIEGTLNADIENRELSVTDEGYETTFTTDIKIYHKKCIIKDGEAISYEIVYPKENADTYEKYIEDMDAGFTVS